MTPEETKQVLAKAALTDSRTVDLTSIRAWHEIIGHLDYTEVLDALTLHRRESADYLQPAHIISNVRRVRADKQREIAKARAIEAGPSTKAEMTHAAYLKHSKRPEFIAAFERARIEGNAERAYYREIHDTGDRAAAQAKFDAVRAEAGL